MQLFKKKLDTTDKIIDKMRSEVVLPKEKQIDQVRKKYNRTATYYITKTMGAIR